MHALKKAEKILRYGRDIAVTNTFERHERLRQERLEKGHKQRKVKSKRLRKDMDSEWKHLMDYSSAVIQNVVDYALMHVDALNGESAGIEKKVRRDKQSIQDSVSSCKQTVYRRKALRHFHHHYVVALNTIKKAADEMAEQADSNSQKLGKELLTLRKDIIKDAREMIRDWSLDMLRINASIDLGALK